MTKIFPKPLKKGDTIAIISPSGYVSYPEKFDKAKKYFENEGYNVKIYPNAKNQKDYLAGTDEERLGDLIEAFENESINAILTSRGGYGALRILDKIDYEVIKNNPKIFCGYSDITAYHIAIYKKTGLVTFHAPFALFDFGADKIDKYTERNFFNILGENVLNLPLENVFEYTCINSGYVKGELLGGNLCTLVSLLGTPFEPDFQDKILFLEDVNEPLYKIDRMLSQLKLAGVFNKVKGLLVGKFSTIEENFFLRAKNLLNELKVPCGYGFSASHELQKITLPLNVNYEINFDEGVICICEEYLQK